MKIDIEKEKKEGAKAYDEALKNDWRLRLEEEALYRKLEDVEERKEKVKSKKKLRRRSR